MAISHSIPKKDADTIVAQAQHPIDVSEDYDLAVRVRSGVVHTYARNTSTAFKSCIECARHEELLKRRERESYPNVESEE